MEDDLQRALTQMIFKSIEAAAALSIGGTEEHLEYEARRRRYCFCSGSG